MRRSKQKGRDCEEKHDAVANLKSKGIFNLVKMSSLKAVFVVGFCLCVSSTVVIFILASHFKSSTPEESIKRTEDYRSDSESENLKVPHTSQSAGVKNESEKAEHQPIIKHGRFKDKSYLNTKIKNSDDISSKQEVRADYHGEKDDIEKEIVIDSKDVSNKNGNHKNYVLLQLVNAHKGSRFADNFYNCVKSILERTKIELTLLLTVDELSKTTAEESLNTIAKELNMSQIPSRTYFLIEEVNKKVYSYTKGLQELFSSGQGAYYSHAIFFLGPVIHKFLPSSIKQLVMLDTDLQFRTDIQELFALFHKMSPGQVMALATDQQPVYRHVLWSYRQKNPGTKVGGPPPDGKAGFNSGVKLVNLEEMRESQIYNDLLHGKNASRLATKYEFKGHLGDQDFYSLVSFDYPDLFYTLPCQWNRQLCTWWKDHGYKDVFDLYFKCSPPFYVIHGNCNTPIPNE